MKKTTSTALLALTLGSVLAAAVPRQWPLAIIWKNVTAFR